MTSCCTLQRSRAGVQQPLQYRRPGILFLPVESLGVIITARLAFPDHHRYGTSDYRTINDSGSSTDLIITTEKDIAKLDKTMIGKRQIICSANQDAVAGEEQFFKAIRAACVGELIITEQYLITGKEYRMNKGTGTAILLLALLGLLMGLPLTAGSG